MIQPSARNSILRFMGGSNLVQAATASFWIECNTTNEASWLPQSVYSVTTKGSQNNFQERHPKHILLWHL